MRTVCVAIISAVVLVGCRTEPNPDAVELHARTVPPNGTAFPIVMLNALPNCMAFPSLSCDADCVAPSPSWTGLADIRTCSRGSVRWNSIGVGRYRQWAVSG